MSVYECVICIKLHVFQLKQSVKAKKFEKICVRTFD